ncbi:aspartyl/asparaginyl beta-hydroxylase isoform X3 [Pectinophora gossypiella]|uniref:aspartyl/asparaginyl beta-hydroxylase isoform X3 n=1 Tax=Pectinophora gossypiella TaxID=13191 RepID=UPI00214ED65B|nr:aspartyl/asparaginyl beta-hydroxylase isoform X3 [Pectinophora gossypiella]
MSGDVQPRKRKDKKKKKDELSLEEPRGTAAALGEGDVFMHSQHDHGTGGHWCAKIIFFSLLAVLITLIGLIILENRGLSELEANAVESRYSGILEGWLEDAPDDDHHDEHTLELKHHADDEDDHDVAHDDHDEDRGDGDDEEEEGHDDETNEDDEEEENDEDEQQDSEERNLEAPDDEDEDDRRPYKYFADDDDDDEEEKDDEPGNDDDDEDERPNNDEEEEPGNEDDEEDNEEDNEDDQDDNQDNDNLSNEFDNNEQDEEQDDEDQDDGDQDDEDRNEQGEENDNDDEEIFSNEDDGEHNDNDEDEEEHEEDEADDEEIEVERIEKEASEEEPISTELPALPEEDDDDDDDHKEDNDDDDAEADNDSHEDEDENEAEGEDAVDDDFLEADDEPVVERITAPAGKPFVEVEEDETSSEQPPQTLEEEEEYEKQQEDLRREEEQSSSHKDGGNSIDDDWPGEPSDAFWRQQLDSAEQNLRQGEWTAALERLSVAELRPSGRARYLVATALDRMAEAKRDNGLLSRAIVAYLDVLKMNEHLPDKKLLQVAQRALDRIQFRGNYLNAEPVYRLLIRRFPNEPAYRNNLTISFLMANRVDLAEDVLKETLARWPNDRVALAHYAFVLKTQQNKLEEAVEMFQKALKGDKGPACEPRFYYHYGDALLLLGRYKEAHEVHKRGAKYGHFLSPAQRSLYNVARLRGRPWWNVADTPYTKLAKALEKAWKDILMEGQAAKTLYEQEKEGLKERGEWSQMDLFVRGQEIPGRCKRAPVTCSIIRAEPAAAGCRRGQIKFSAMEPGTHVRPHVGPTNCRLRMHLGLSNTKDTYIRVDQETRQWQEGKVLLFDDSFEHEVWHNGTGKRLVLIVDVWHPDLTAAERRSLPAI